MSVAQISPGRGRRREVDHDIDALLLDAQRRYLSEPCRLDEANSTREYRRATTVIEFSRRARADCGSVGRQYVYDNLKCAWIANFEDRRSGGDDGLAFLGDSQHLASHG